MYAIIAIAVVLIFYIENRDWRCSNSYSVWEKCENNDGMAFRGSKPNESDSPIELLNKIDIASNTYQKSIKWRRAFVISVGIAFLSFILVITPGKLPIWTTFYLVIMIGWFLLYTNFYNYEFHKYNLPKEYIKESTEILRKNLN
jgi:hypothetical protein